MIGPAIGALYLLCGLAFMASIGRPHSKFEWDGKPSAGERIVVVVCWWAIWLEVLL
jgi:hypothetical protein